jgi:N utilization substance protein B
VTNANHEAAGAGGQPANLARSAARLNAVQALYQMAISGGTAEAIIGQFTAAGPQGRADDGDEPVAEADRSLFADLVQGTHDKMTDIDEMLSGCLDDAWPVERIEILLRAILRCGAYELFSQPAVPARVVISEYIRVTDAFFEGKEPSLVNAVLDRLARVLRPEELAAEDSS